MFSNSPNVVYIVNGFLSSLFFHIIHFEIDTLQHQVFFCKPKVKKGLQYKSVMESQRKKSVLHFAYPQENANFKSSKDISVDLGHMPVHSFFVSAKIL